MKRILYLCLALALTIGLAIVAYSDTTIVPGGDKFPGCDFIEFGGRVTTPGDTLWYTSSQANAGAGLSFDGGTGVELETLDNWEPREVPIASKDGVLIKDLRRVKIAYFAGVEPYTLTIWQNGETTAAGGARVIIPDSTGNRYAGDWLAPYQYAVLYPDSVIVSAVAAGDSVSHWLGY